MRRNFVALLTMMMIVGAVGAPGASGQLTVEGAGANDETTLTALKDGTGKTAHQVLDIRKADGTGVLSLTCNEVAGTGTIKGPSVESASLGALSLQGNCSFAGQTVTVENTECIFILTLGSQKWVHIGFSVGCKVHFTNTTLNCKVEIGEQILSGLNYSTLGDGTITVEATNLAFAYNATGVGCPYGSTSNGLVTTGNFILRGTKKGTGTTVNLKWDS